jgi:hypothetical protein
MPHNPQNVNLAKVKGGVLSVKVGGGVPKKFSK